VIADACFDFWFKFVMPRTASIEQGMGGAVLDEIFEQKLDDYLGHRFERLCTEWMLAQARAGRFEITVSQVAAWWGTNATSKQQTDVDVLAADLSNKKLILGECKYRNNFNETEEIEKLLAKSSLFKGYITAGYVFFSKKNLSSTALKKYAHKGDGSEGVTGDHSDVAADNTNITFITVDDIFSE
jgi:hypothetical protein